MSQEKGGFMEFKSRQELELYTKRLKYLGLGSCGICFLSRSNDRVIKVFHKDAEVIRDRDHLLRYKDLSNDSFIFADDVITIDGEIVGIISPYIRGLDLCRTNPLHVDLDQFEVAINNAHLDVEDITEKGITLNDVMYNIIYDKHSNNLFVKDYDEFSSTRTSFEQNRAEFDLELYYFLVDGILNGFVESDSVLKELYSSKENDILTFLDLYRKKLSEYMGFRINCLAQVHELITSNSKGFQYVRSIKKGRK